MLSGDVWNKTPLLKTFSERLQSMLNHLISVDSSNERIGVSHVRVYVHLYHQNGNELTIWEDMVKKIQHIVDRRPIYLTFNEAKREIRDPIKEALVVMDVPKYMVMEMDGKRYINSNSAKGCVTGFFWNGKSFHFNDLELTEMNSILSD